MELLLPLSDLAIGDVLRAGVIAQQMDEAKDRLTKENENRKFMSTAEDDFHQDEMSATLIRLRYQDLMDECDVILVGTDAAWLTSFVSLCRMPNRAGVVSTSLLK